MYPQGQNLGNDSDSLQTDVMRFMAIIAFCLIAILALVKNAEPVEATPAPPAAPVETAEVTDPSPWKPVVNKTPEPVQLPTTESIQTASESIQTSAQPVAEEVAEPAEPQLAAEVIDTPAAKAPPPQVPEQQQAAAPETDVAPPAEKKPPTPEEEEGLILRFASDGDFLRLIAKGDIKVYAFQESDVLTLNASYRFLDTKSPGQVYELLRPSIPGLIVDALKQERRNIDGFRWGIALPGHISNQIERHLGQVTGGQLVINRYGDVRHVAAS